MNRCSRPAATPRRPGHGLPSPRAGTPDTSDTSGGATLRLGEPSPARLPRLTLEVFGDGCGLIRSEPKPGVSYENLAWSIRDRDGFQVLQRNALGETHYRYFVGGTYTAVLEAWDGEKYAAVSNEVTIRC